MSIIKVDINKFKEIAHQKRRMARAEEFAPLDIKATIPFEQAQAEAERVKIREKYDKIQNDIDSINNVSDLAQLVKLL
jgi:hypothetical protein